MSLQCNQESANLSSFPIRRTCSILPLQQEQIKGGELETREKGGEPWRRGVVAVGCPVAPAPAVEEGGFAPKQSEVGNCCTLETTKGKGKGSLTGGQVALAGLPWCPFLFLFLFHFLLNAFFFLSRNAFCQFYCFLFLFKDWSTVTYFVSFRLF